MDDFDRSRCSFPVPEFGSVDAEIAWVMSLSAKQRLEIMHWMRVAKWGEEAVNAPMDRTHIQAMTMQEFNEMKEREAAEDLARQR